jgi:hypothetical protein
MKKFICLLSVVALLFLSSCSSTTPAAAGAPDLTVSAVVSLTVGSVTLYKTSTSDYVTGATVTVNSQALPYLGSGIYGTTGLTGISTGSSVNLSVSTSLGNVTASGTMPASGNFAIIPVSGAAAGSTLTLSNM